MLTEPLALRGPIAGFNGGVFVNPDLSVIESHTLDLAAAKQALQLMLDQGWTLGLGRTARHGRALYDRREVTRGPPFWRL